MTEVAKAAYAISQQEGHPPGHARQDWLEAEAQLQHGGYGHRSGTTAMITMV